MILTRPLILAIALGLIPNLAFAFASGSTGVDGAFNPAASTTLPLPPTGIFNFTTVNIPAGVTVTFTRNAGNTPVVILASGDVTIAGIINVSGNSAPATGAAGDGNLADDGLPGKGGPGGYDGGNGAPAREQRAGNGLGPGAGGGGKSFFIPGNGWYVVGGGGAGFADAGTDANYAPTYHPGVAGGTYGSSPLLPLIGGSGGGGGGGGENFAGSGGGGGGGAILIAASGTVNLTGTVYAYGGDAGASSGAGCGGVGGGGSGGAIRIVATTLTGEGGIGAQAGNASATCGYAPGPGSPGRIRLEADFFKRTTGTNPVYTVAPPGSLFITGLPSLTITSIAGVSVTPATSVMLPTGTANPVTVTLATTGVPIGNTITLSVTPANGNPITATSTALAGTSDNAAALASVSLPTGASTLSASVSYTVTTALGDAWSTFAQGERVKRVELSANAAGESITTLITVSGKKYRLQAKDRARSG